MNVTRRDFFRIGGSASLGLALASSLSQQAAVAQAAVATQMGVLIDISRCIGCRSCEAACRKANNLPQESQDPDNRKLSAYTFTFVDKERLQVAARQTETRFVKRQCMHCLQPACVSVCPVGALQKGPNGQVIYKDERCIGCRYCMTACPFDIPRYEWQSTKPLIRKCQFCVALTANGDKTACASVCPAGALKCGSRAELLQEAAERIKANPERYVDYIYGKDEVGGTAVLYLSNVPFEQLGFRMDLPKEPLPKYTSQVMSNLPALVVGLALALGTTTIATRRSQNGNGANGAHRADEGKKEGGQS